MVARYGENPLQVINNLKAKIEEISPGLPSKTLADGTESHLEIVPFYDRSGLIHETLGTLEEALSLEILITILVIIVLVTNLRASILIAGLLPLAVLMVFIVMRYSGVDANIVALSGIAIAIGTMVDLGIVLSENIIKFTEDPENTDSLKDKVYKASAEVSGAIVTAVATTIVSFIPVFSLEAAEGKLFRPLAFTKTFALLSALLVSLLILPTIAHMVFGFKLKNPTLRLIVNAGGFVLGLVALWFSTWGGISLLLLSVAGLITYFYAEKYTWTKHLSSSVVLISVTFLLSRSWLPLGPENSQLTNFLFVVFNVALILGCFKLIEYKYAAILHWCLEYKKVFLTLPILLILIAANIWLGFSAVFAWLPDSFKSNKAWGIATATFSGIGEEFMPSLDEGSFLLMPTSMPHAGIVQSKEVLQELDMRVYAIPEVDLVVGKLGRVESSLDPAPISMYENIIQYKPEYALDEKGRRKRFQMDKRGRYLTLSGDSLSRDSILKNHISVTKLKENPNGDFFRNWRDHIQSKDDIWEEIVQQTNIPGVTSAPKLQPIETRLIMLQTGMRAPMGIKVYGQDLKDIERFSFQLEKRLKEVPAIKSETVFADRIVGKPYLELDIDRDKIARYGLSIEDVQQQISAAVGGTQVSTTVEGRERFAIRVRYPRELREDPESIANILIGAPNGSSVPLGSLVDFNFVKGPQMIKSEDTFLVGYVLFDKSDGFAETDVVIQAKDYLDELIEKGSLKVPKGVNYKFSGSYENQLRASKRLSWILPVVLLLVFLILYFQFRSISTSLMVFAGITMAFSGAFLMLWLYGKPWFLDFGIGGINFRDLFQIHTINLSVAVWVGFIALFGIATDDGVLIATYLDQSFRENKTKSIEQIRAAVLEGGQKRIRPAIMTSATTIIALLPVLSSTGKGSDIMVPMAIPAFGGMLVASITYFITPVLYAMREERKFKKS